MMINFTTAASIDLLNLIHKKNLQDIYPNIEIDLRNHLTSNNCLLRKKF